MSARRVIRSLGLAAPILAAALLLAGCATHALDAARYDYYGGRFERAETRLDDDTRFEKDRVLFLMERGTIRQAGGDYEDSSRDFIAASDLLEKLETYSVSKGAASWVVNDGVQSFKGTPYERTLLHAFTAMNHLALGRWDDAAVESRRIIKTLNPEALGNYPDVAFARYMAGFCLELIDDDSNAALQYRQANTLLSHVQINEVTGHILPKPPSTNSPAAQAPLAAADADWPAELVCFILAGRSARGSDQWRQGWASGMPVYAEIQVGGRALGRSYSLTDTTELAFTTDQIEAVRKAAKAAGRVMLKEGVAISLEQSGNEELAALVRLILIGLLEQPDLRRWETLPRWLQVARVPCPPDLKAFDVVLKSASGVPVRTLHVEEPLRRWRKSTYVSFCRDIPPAPSR